MTGRRGQPGAGRVTGADPAALDRARRGGPEQARALMRAGADVAAAGDHVRATCDVAGVADAEVLAGCHRLAEGVARLDAWVGRVAATLRDADHVPPSVTALRLAHLRHHLTGAGPAERALAAAGRSRDGIDLGVLWAALDPATLDAEALALLGAGPDVPVSLRDAANREAVARHVAGLAARLVELDSELAALDDEGTWTERLGHRVDRAVDDLLLDRLGHVADVLVELGDRRTRLADETATLRRVLDEPGWTIIGFARAGTGPDGDSTLRLALGDLDTATHVAVLVPGTTTGTHAAGASLRDARALHAAARSVAVAHGGGRDVATVLELHDAPDDLVAAAGTSHATAAAPPLAALVDELAGRGARTTVVGHSHGAVVAGLAGRAGMAADALVLLGAPGAGFAHVDELALEPGAATWAVHAPGEPIGLVTRAGEALHALPPEVRARLPERLARPGGLHGPDPTDPAVGTRRFAVDAACEGDPSVAQVLAPQPRGHLQYLAHGTATLANTARVVVGVAPSAPCPPAGQRSGAARGGPGGRGDRAADRGRTSPG